MVDVTLNTLIKTVLLTPRNTSMLGSFSRELDDLNTRKMLCYAYPAKVVSDHVIKCVGALASPGVWDAIICNFGEDGSIETQWRLHNAGLERGGGCYWTRYYTPGKVPLSLPDTLDRVSFLVEQQDRMLRSENILDKADGVTWWIALEPARSDWETPWDRFERSIAGERHLGKATCQFEFPQAVFCSRSHEHSLSLCRYLTAMGDARIEGDVEDTEG